MWYRYLGQARTWQLAAVNFGSSGPLTAGRTWNRKIYQSNSTVPVPDVMQHHNNIGTPVEQYYGIGYVSIPTILSASGWSSKLLPRRRGTASLDTSTDLTLGQPKTQNFSKECFISIASVKAKNKKIDYSYQVPVGNNSHKKTELRSLSRSRSWWSQNYLRPGARTGAESIF